MRTDDNKEQQTMYLLSVCRGEYDDSVRTPLIVVNNLAAAELFRSVFEARDHDAIQRYCPLLHEIIPEESTEEFSIDIDAIPFISL